MSLFSRKQKNNNVQPSSVREANLLAENFDLKNELQKIKLHSINLETKLKAKEYINVKLGDPGPIDSEKRALYVAKVAGLHKEILEPKLKQMISTAHTLLEESTNDREFYQSVKGGIYMLWEILRWGELMVNEQISNQMSQNPSLVDEQITK